jgi:hypothetical protein
MRSVSRLAAGLLGICGALSACVAAAADEPAKSPEPIADRIGNQVVPLVEAYCLGCHSAKKKRGDLDLSAFTTELSVLKARKTWETVQRMIRAGEMPPEDHPQPTLAEKERLLKAVDDTLNAIDCSQSPDPGRVTIRRLNRTEYNNTIHDLTGVNFRPAEDFPADDIGYGFDHIGDVLSLPPVLFEKYMVAAERILADAIRDGDPVNGPIRRYSSRDMKWTGPGEAHERNKHGRVLHTQGELQAELELAREYEFVANVRMSCDPAGPEPVKAALRLDGQDVQVLETRERKSRTYPVRMTIPAGKHTLSVAFLNDYYDPDNADPQERDRNLVLEYIDMQGPIDVSPTLSEQLILICRPAADGHDEAACVRRIIGNFATRAFRGPAADGEIELYARVFDGQRQAGESYNQSLRLALAAVLVSPRFLFRIEADSDAADSEAIRLLGDYELASRLSYFLWSTMPDAELFAVAAAGELRRPEVLRQQVGRMLHDRRRQALIENFAGQWLQLRNLSVLAPDKGVYPGFDDALRQAMRRETELFFEAIVEEDRSLLEFLDARYTFVNERLAKHYGLEGISGDQFQRVEFPNDQRGGVLTHAAILTVTSNPTRTSPVKRGKWVLENFLGTVPPPPPPMVEELDDSAGAALKGTLRQRTEQHRANPACASCHLRMDPLGFGLENFDGIGAWRTKDGEFTIDPSGDLPSGESFKTPRELRAILVAHRDEFIRCLTEKMLTYALGRGLEYYDKCATDRIAAAVHKADYRFSTLIEEIVMSVPFQKRRAVKGEQ